MKLRAVDKWITMLAAASAFCAAVFLSPLGKRSIVEIFFLGLLFGLLAFAAAGAFRGDDQEPTDEPDPHRRALRRPKALLGAFLVMAVATNIFYFDVLWCGKTTVSAPYFNHKNDPGETTAGFGYLNDPWAGYLIEGPGFFLTHDALERGEWPLWNHKEACGAPYLANGETAPLSLLQLPLHLRPSIRAWDLFAIARIFLAGCFAVLFLRGLGCSMRSAALGGIGYAFSDGFILHANLVHSNTDLLTPLFLWAADALFHRRTILRFLGLTAAAGLALNGGNPQPFVIALLVAGIRAILQPVEGDSPGRFSRCLWLAGATIGGAALSAITIIPLEVQLGSGVTRALLGPTGTASIESALAFIAPHRAIGDPTLEIVQPSLWHIGGVIALPALATVIAGILNRERSRLAVIVPTIVLLSTIFFPATVELFGKKLPVFSSINWPKYIGPTHLLFAALAAFFFDDIVAMKKNVRGAFGFALFATFVLAAVARDKTTAHQTTSIAVVIAVGILFLMQIRFFRRAGLWIVPILALAELLSHRPHYPDRRAEIRAGAPKAVDFIGEKCATDERLLRPFRAMAPGDVVSPLFSGVLGWHDVRSVSPIPLRSYHEFWAPYTNCGAWPPYLLLGATREILFSPCLDLASVKWVMIKDHRLLAARIDDAAEVSAAARFGAFHRAVDFARFRLIGAEKTDPDDASFTMSVGGEMETYLDLLARSVKMTFEIDGPKDARARIRIGDDRRVLSPGKTESFEIRSSEPVRFEMGVLAGNGVRIRIVEWSADRFRPKSIGDFGWEFGQGYVDYDAGVMVLLNKSALPIARIAERTRRIADDSDFAEIYRRFVATGEGWDWRKETLIVDDPSAPMPEFGPGAVDVPVDFEFDGTNSMRAETTVDRASWLTVSVTLAEGWRASVNDEPVEIYRANGPFMAIPLASPGKKVVKFEYSPTSFRVGRAISAAAVALFFVALAIGLLRRARAV